MPATNANNAGWFMLREGTDFEPRSTGGATDSTGPVFEDSRLFFDDDRRVLEFAPLPPRFEQPPPPGWAGAGLGEEYASDPRTLRLTVKRCDGSVEPFPRDPCIVRCAAGLAIDRRGYLYAADPGQRAVIVIDPGSEHVEARLRTAGMIEPVDVAVDHQGRIYVADRAGERIVVFSPRFQPIGSWVPRNSDGLPAKPRPVAVMISAEGDVLVADGSHPRLLRFSAAGEPLADVEFATLIRPADPPCVCAPAVAPCPGRGCADKAAVRSPFDVALDLARNHRLTRLRPRRAYPTSGSWLSAILDSRRHNTTWHKLEVDTAIPGGCAVQVQTATSNDRDELAASPVWTPEGTDDDPATAVNPGAPDLLIQSPPGRFMRVRLSLTSSGRATPGVRSLRVLFPRNSYLDALPRIYRATMGDDRFLEQFLALFESVLTRLEDRYEEFSRWLDPEAAPAAVLTWLAGLLDLVFDKDWPLARRRALLLRINDLYRIKGTPRGITEYIRAYTGLESQVQEDFLRRPAQPAFLGRRGFVLGTTSLLNTASPDRGADEALFDAFAHRFTILVYLGERDCSERALGVIERIVSATKPAHTVHKVVPVYPGANLGIGSRVGIDLVLTGKSMPAAVVARCDDRPEDASTLGHGMVLGDLGPAFPRPRGHRL